MDRSIITALREERKALQKKLAAVESALAAYGIPSSSPPSIEERPRTNPSPRGPSEKTLKIRAQVVTYLELFGGPTPTHQILEFLEGEGVEVGGKRPLATLSALLSNSPEFQASGRKGWVLRNSNEGPDAGASEPKLFAGEVAPSPNERQDDDFDLA